MSTDFEQRLRAEMEQVKVNPRPGLVNAAYRSYRGKRRLIRALAATGTAMAIAAGTAAGVAAATSSPAAIPAQTTAYIVSHISSALATNDEISHTTVSYGPPGNTQVVLYHWKYGTRFRDLSEFRGQPDSDNWGQDFGRPDGYQILVDYPRRSWERLGAAQYSTVVPSFACPTYGRFFIPLSQWEPADLSSIIESGLRCGAFRVAGHQRVDGTDTIELTAIYDGKPLFTLWVDASTYLPVQLTAQQEEMQFRWLPPTQANLAQLTGTIPPGFHRT
ncbi:MAG: hypothetical protein ACRDOB_09930 [Streptosporangiaceae bacterium]